MIRYAALGALFGLSLIVSMTAHAQSSKRTELTKGDLTGTNMEIVVGTVEVQPRASGVLHTHPGDEAYYVIDGATGLLPDGKPINFEPGVARINVRDVPLSKSPATKRSSFLQSISSIRASRNRAVR